MINGYLDQQGYKAERGSIVDASIVEAPRQRNSRESNQQIKEGKTPEHWKDQPNKLNRMKNPGTILCFFQISRRFLKKYQKKLEKMNF